MYGRNGIELGRSSMGLTYFLVRHAQSLRNAGLLHSNPNAALSAHGIHQASALAAHFSEVGLDSIVASPFLRTIETALPVSVAANCGISIKPDIQEYFSFRDWAALCVFSAPSLSCLCEQFPRVSASTNARDWWPRKPETEEMFVARIGRFMKCFRFRYSSGKHAIITHGACVSYLARSLVPGFQIGKVPNASVTEIVFYKDEPVLKRVMDVSHLSNRRFIRRLS